MCVDGNPPGRHMHKLETTTRRLLFYIISSSCASFGMKGEEEEEDMPSRHFTCKVNKISFHLSPPPHYTTFFLPPFTLIRSPPFSLSCWMNPKESLFYYLFI
jgi:hypothetical protein